MMDNKGNRRERIWRRDAVGSAARGSRDRWTRRRPGDVIDRRVLAASRRAAPSGRLRNPSGALAAASPSRNR